MDYELDPPDRELITAPIHFVNGNRSSGDCDCMTTLLVCLLEAAGFDAAITVIAWRLEDYTHVYAEVFYNKSWFVLDPTLRSNGFGKQDKKIRRYRRFTKKDMQKLTVLADGAASPEPRPMHRIPRRNCRNGRCKDDDNNRNNNNININFGTNVENSHNRSAYESNSDVGNYSSRNVARPVVAGNLPMLRPA